MFKDLLVPATASAGGDNTLAAAIALAEQFSARLTVLELVTLPILIDNPWGFSPGAFTVEIYNRLRAEGEIHMAHLRALLSKSPVSSEVRLVETLMADPTGIAARQAHHVDLTIVPGASDEPGDDAIHALYFGAMLLESGRPVLMVPPSYHLASPARRIVLAWRATREAARAVHDALPFLLRAERVDVLVANAGRGSRIGPDDSPGSDIALHLARHGIQANVVVRDDDHRPVSALILECARECMADMIVAGGYGHSRLREWAVGGVTRELRATSPVPVLFSH